MRRPGKAPVVTPPADDIDGGAPALCPFCGYHHHIKDVIAVHPGLHSIRRCLGCGLRFDSRERLCPWCGSPGEYLGAVAVPDRGLYIQYRCHRCSQGFMIQNDR